MKLLFNLVFDYFLLFSAATVFFFIGFQIYLFKCLILRFLLVECLFCYFNRIVCFFCINDSPSKTQEGLWDRVRCLSGDLKKLHLLWFSICLSSLSANLSGFFVNFISNHHKQDIWRRMIFYLLGPKFNVFKWDLIGNIINYYNT